MPRGPDFDLAQILFDKGLSQISSQGERPQTDDRMTPLAGLRAGKRHAGAHLAAGLVQAFDQILRQERTVAGNAHDPLDAAVVRGKPVEARKNAGERTSEI